MRALSVTIHRTHEGLPTAHPADVDGLAVVSATSIRVGHCRQRRRYRTGTCLGPPTKSVCMNAGSPANSALSSLGINSL